MKYLIFFLLPFLLPACAPSQASEAENAEAARLSHVEPTVTEVVTAAVRRGNFALELVSNGKLEARNKAVVPFVVQEQITEVTVQEGQRVNAGQLLGRVEAFTYRKRLDEALNRYEQSLIDLEDMLLGHGYALRDSASVPEGIFKMARIRSGYNNAVTSLNEAQRNLSQTNILAPFAGTVANLQARANNPSASFKMFCEVMDINTMHLVFHLLETEATQVQKGQEVELTPFAMPGKTFTGTVTSINPSVDDKGMVRITAIIPNPNNLLMDGMNARVLLKNQVPQCLIIPKEALLYRQNRKIVFQYKDDKAIWVYVETGHENSREITITDGLEEGMEVIVENNLNLAHESQVIKK